MKKWNSFLSLSTLVVCLVSSPLAQASSNDTELRNSLMLAGVQPTSPSSTAREGSYDLKMSDVHCSADYDARRGSVNNWSAECHFIANNTFITITGSKALILIGTLNRVQIFKPGIRPSVMGGSAKRITCNTYVSNGGVFDSCWAEQ